MTEDNEVYFGDIAVSFITEKSTDISKEVVEKNFVDAPPQVFELTPDLESGTYSIVMNENYHPKNENFKEQRDALRSMTFRNSVEYPVEITSDKGHIIPESTSVNITPSEQFEEGEITLRFLDDYQYQPVISHKQDKRGDFDVESSPIVPIPSIVENVSEDSEYTISTEEGDMELYASDDLISYDLPEDYAKPEQISPARLSDDDERVYSDKLINTGSVVENGFIKASYDENRVNISYFDSSWQDDLIEVDISIEDYGYAEVNENYEVKTNWRESYNSSLYRGLPLIEFNIDAIESFDLSTSSPSEVTEEDYYYVIEEDEYEIILVRLDDEGDFYIDGEDFGVENLDFDEYVYKIGIVPDTISREDFVKYIYNYQRPRRTFQQR